MDLYLSRIEVEKILSSLNTEQIEQMLEVDYSYWYVYFEADYLFKLTKKEMINNENKNGK